MIFLDQSFGLNEHAGKRGEDAPLSPAASRVYTHARARYIRGIARYRPSPRPRTRSPRRRDTAIARESSKLQAGERKTLTGRPASKSATKTRGERTKVSGSVRVGGRHASVVGFEARKSVLATLGEQRRSITMWSLPLQLVLCSEATGGVCERGQQERKKNHGRANRGSMQRHTRSRPRQPAEQEGPPLPRLRSKVNRFNF